MTSVIPDATIPPEHAAATCTASGGWSGDPTAALLEVQTAYYTGQLPREAAMNNVRLVFGLGQDQAEALFPPKPPPPAPSGPRPRRFTPAPSTLRPSPRPPRKTRT